MGRILIKGATIVNEGTSYISDILLVNGFIDKISTVIESEHDYTEVINAAGPHLLPGLIDDQVHFREPGLTHKADIYTESRATAAGGITSFMEMPNTVPNTLNQFLLEEKYQLAAEVSAVNYSFFMGASNDNLSEVLYTNPKNVCGVKVFMGSSTGNMLVDKRATLEGIFRESPTIVATHCEDEATIAVNAAHYAALFGDKLNASHHPLIRSAEACYQSSSFAIELASKHNTRLHILHMATGVETELFSKNTPLAEKKITAEACIHHLWFSDADYEFKGNFIKWNPAIKTSADREMIRQAVNENRIDVIATDHAPHTLDEKMGVYTKAPSGCPLVQHALPALLDRYHAGVFNLEKIVEKTSHNVATLFQINRRGNIREGYFADLVLVDLNKSFTVSRNNIFYKCGWSPFEGHTFLSSVIATTVNGTWVWKDGVVVDNVRGERLTFNR